LIVETDLCEAREIHKLKVRILLRIEVQENFFITHILGIPHPERCPLINLCDNFSEVGDDFFIQVVFIFLKNTEIRIIY